MHELQHLDITQLAAVTGGAAATPTPPPPPKPQQPQQPPQQPKQGGPDTQWIQNTISCARIGGPILGALCGVLTPSPAY